MNEVRCGYPQYSPPLWKTCASIILILLSIALVIGVASCINRPYVEERRITAKNTRNFIAGARALDATLARVTAEDRYVRALVHDLRRACSYSDSQPSTNMAFKLPAIVIFDGPRSELPHNYRICTELMYVENVHNSVIDMDQVERYVAQPSAIDDRWSDTRYAITAKNIPPYIICRSKDEVHQGAPPSFTNYFRTAVFWSVNNTAMFWSVNNSANRETSRSAAYTATIKYCVIDVDSREVITSGSFGEVPKGIPYTRELEHWLERNLGHIGNEWRFVLYRR